MRCHIERIDANIERIIAFIQFRADIIII